LGTEVFLGSIGTPDGLRILKFAMVDREARNRLLRGIDDYMDEKMTAAEFDALLHKAVAPPTKDKLVQTIIDQWFFDTDFDVGVHRIQSDCAYWKYFNRCRLLLASDADYQTETLTCRLNFFGWFGGLVILVVAVLVLLSFWLQSVPIMLVGISLYALYGIALSVSMLFTKWESERNILYAEYPFESFADLLAVRRSVPDFSSKRFPNKPPIPAPVSNRLYRFLCDTKCPAWVDRIGDAFIELLAWACLILPFVIAFWPLGTLLSLFSRNEQRKLVVPESTAMPE